MKPEERLFKAIFGVSPQSRCVCEPSPMLDFIRNIYANEEKKVVVVLFKDNTKEVVKCHKEDNFSVYIGVAIAIARHHFGTPSQFHKIVNKKTTYMGQQKVEEKKNEYSDYVKWARKNGKYVVTLATFNKNKAKYLNRMKGEK